MQSFWDKYFDVLVKIWIASVIGFWLCMLLRIKFLFVVFGFIMCAPIACLQLWFLFKIIGLLFSFFIPKENKPLDTPKADNETQTNTDNALNREDILRKNFSTVQAVAPNIGDITTVQLKKKKRKKSRIDKLIEQMQNNEYIGRIYEEKIGAIYEGKNYTVDYNGIEKGKEDGGIDLIARKGNEILLIQCKRFAANKQIHEKYIGYLKGVIDLYEVPEGFICRGVFFASCPLSDRALKLAKMYNFEIHDNFWPE